MNADELLSRLGRSFTSGFAHDLLTAKRLEDERALERFGFKVYSQNEEDGILEEIFNRIGTTNKLFVEFGVQNGLECNSHYLLLKGWSGLWLEGNEKHVAEINARFYPAIKTRQLKCRNAFITRENINRLIADAGFVGSLDLLSIDIDGNDYHVWKAIDVVDPRVVAVEYNAKLPPNFDWKMAYNAQHVWDGSDNFGASLKAFELLGRERGYQLVGTNITGSNAFFVKRELAEGKFLEPSTAEFLYNPARYELCPKFVGGHPAKVFLGNQLPNIGMLNYNPVQYRQYQVDRSENKLPEDSKKALEKKLAALNLAARNMIFQPPKTHSKFFLPLANSDLIQQLIILGDDYFEGGMLRKIFYDFKGGLLARLIDREGSVVVDIGANIGNHTLFFANELHARKIISFEPIPETFKLLMMNVHLNGLQNRVELHNEGLSNEPGHASVTVFNPGNIGGTTLAQGAGNLSLTTLDSLNLPNVTFIKIDVEGMEPEVLEGSIETIKRTRPIVFVESFPDKFPIVEEFFAKLDYRYAEEAGYNYLFYPSEYHNRHDAAVENYELVLVGDADETQSKFIEKNLGHDKIVSVETPAAALEHARDCEADYCLIRSANSIPLKPIYFLNFRQKIFHYAGLGLTLVKTSIVREFLDASSERSIEAYQKFALEKYPTLHVEKKAEIKNGAAELFGRTLTADELTRLPYDAVVF